jgi:FkbM family methyltransferase
MKYDPVKHFLRMRVRRGRTWSLLRRGLVSLQYFSRSPDEAEIRVFQALEKVVDDGLLLADIGANGGQTAAGFASLLRSAHIVSFEPNPELWPELDYVGRLIGGRFEYRRHGLGSETSTLTLYVPHIDQLPVTTRASVNRETADGRCRDLVNEGHSKVQIRETTVQIEAFDDLGLMPHGVKIDVEGAELSVLQGMRSTISECLPLIMLEYNEETAECRRLLEPFGYDFWDFDTEKRGLSKSIGNRTRNWFAVPPSASLRAALGVQ